MECSQPTHIEIHLPGFEPMMYSSHPRSLRRAAHALIRFAEMNPVALCRQGEIEYPVNDTVLKYA